MTFITKHAYRFSFGELKSKSFFVKGANDLQFQMLQECYRYVGLRNDHQASAECERIVDK